MKTIARLPLTQLSADETHVEAFKALAHLSRLQVFFLLVKVGRWRSCGCARRTWPAIVRWPPHRHIGLGL